MRHPKNLEPEKRAARRLSVAGLLLAGLGFAGVIAAFTIAPGQLVGLGFALFWIMAGLGLFGLGFTNLREARTLEREDALAHEPRAGPADQDALLRSVEERRRREKRRFVRVLAVVLTATATATAVLVAVLPRPSLESRFDVESVERLYDEAVALAETAAGHRLVRKPPLRVLSRMDAADLLRRIYEAEVRKLNPRGRVDDPEASVDAWDVAVWRPAVYAPTEHAILLIPMNIVAPAERYKTEPVYLGKPYLRYLLVHEVAHALDEERFHRLAQYAPLEDGNAMLVWSALSEGHAEHVAQRAVEALEPAGWLTSYRSLSGNERDADEKFKYWYGLLFFERLDAAGLGSELGRVFAAPPPRPEDVLEPDDYFDSIRAWKRATAPAEDPSGTPAFKAAPRLLSAWSDLGSREPELRRLVERGDEVFARALKDFQAVNPIGDPEGWARLNEKAWEAFRESAEACYDPAEDLIRFGTAVPMPLLDRLRAARINASLCRARRATR